MVRTALFPDDAIVSFDATAARLAAELYAAVRRPRSREGDLAIAACAAEYKYLRGTGTDMSVYILSSV